LKNNHYVPVIYLSSGEKGVAGRGTLLKCDELKLFLEQILKNNSIIGEEVHKTSMAHLKEKLFIFIDESHFDPNWSLTGKVVYDQTRKIFMIFTGSSALSLEINVDAVRRINNEKIYPMNFSEHLLLKHRILSPEGFSNSLSRLIWNKDDNSLTQAVECESEAKKMMLDLER
jgi:predicted AAA+ superfamily ATPase